MMMNDFQNDLLHYGVKRRSGRYPYGSGERPFQDMEGKYLPTLAKKKRKISSRDIYDISKKTGEISRDTVSTINSVKKKKKIDIPDVSDDELRNMVNRLNMEKRYKELKSEDLKDGFDRISDALTIVSGLSAISASAATIYTLLKNK